MPPRSIGRPLSAADYYRDDAVRARIFEHCGARPTRPASAAYIATVDTDTAGPFTWDRPVKVPVSELARLLDDGRDVSRSLWDTEHLLFFFEIDYLNSDRPAEPFVHPADVFLKLEPTYHAVTGTFGALHLRARPFISGRGYHFVGKIPLADPMVDALASLVPDTPVWFDSYLDRRPPAITATLTPRQARAADGLGLLLEYVAHLVLAESGASPIPVVVNGTTVGPGPNGRECVSIDFSHAGDPLDVRHVRTAFSAYQWHRLRPDIFGAAVALGVPPLAIIPRQRHSLMTLLLSGRDLHAGVEAAHGNTAVMPNVVTGIRALLARYRAAPLAAFHREFLAARRSAADSAPTLNVPALPPCMAAPLVQPNDLLLKPEHLQHLVRGLLSRGWRAAQIAALVQEVYEADHDWADRWHRMHPHTRADFDVRVFAGLVATGADTLVDFNCVSAQEKGLCPRTGCQYDLRRDRDRLEAGVPS
ncbi:MAG: hypothetical protein ACHQO8_00770 [Vicinamibacterales bacterium]